MLSLHLLYTTLIAMFTERVRALRREPELGAGGVSLEHVLLAIGSVVAAGIVVAVIASVINSKTGELNP